jgi:hypothetical protein
MDEKEKKDYEGANRRSEPRYLEGEYSSVELSLKELNFVYQFKIWDRSKSGMSILIKEDSEVLRHLKVGDILDMKYYPEESTDEPIRLRTEIRHITKDASEKIKGHCLVGLLVHDRP